MTPEIILGPPGTGKTSVLLGVVEEELAAGTPPDRIGYVSFTRRAADEAASRACVKFGLQRSALPYFRTLHSLCFRQLGLRSGDVLQGKRLQDFAQYAGVRVTGRWSEDGTLSGYELGDRVLMTYNLARVRMTTLEDQHTRDFDGLPWARVRDISAALDRFKQEHHLIDYTDMLHQFVLDDRAPPLDLLCVDETQDLSVLQWQVVWRLAQGCRRMLVAGDDDQAIFRWAGADVDTLIDMEGTVRVLNQSWRVPPAVQAVAAGVISRVTHRRDKQWSARQGSQGQVDVVRGFDEVGDLGGEVLVLARNTYLLWDQVVPELRRQGVVYEVDGHPSIRPAFLAAIQTWEALRRGESVLVDSVRGVYELMSAGKGVRHGQKKLPNFTPDEVVDLDLLEKQGGLLTRAIWHEAMDRLPRDEVSYIIAARQNGERLTKARVRLSTIHGSKGGEADHVVLMKEMARRTFRELDLAPEDEARVWYVGATRARERLTLVRSQTAQECPWL